MPKMKIKRIPPSKKTIMLPVFSTYEHFHQMLEFRSRFLAETGMHFRHLDNRTLWRDEPVPSFVLRQFADRTGRFAAPANLCNKREVLFDLGDGRIGKKRAEPIAIEGDASFQISLSASVENDTRVDKFRPLDARHDADDCVIKRALWHGSPPVQKCVMMQAGVLKNWRSVRDPRPASRRAVSYTHLTLPTI